MELLRVPRAFARGHCELSRSFQGKETVGLALCVRLIPLIYFFYIIEHRLSMHLVASIYNFICNFTKKYLFKEMKCGY